MPKQSTTIWFLGSDEKGRPEGFTSIPEQAIKDRNGNPIVCPGDMNRVWKAEFARQQKKKDKLWEKLLDLMEQDMEDFEAQEAAQESKLKGEDGAVMWHRTVKRNRLKNRGVMKGIQMALAELELPENRSTTAEEDLAWVRQRAQLKYDQESE